MMVIGCIILVVWLSTRKKSVSGASSAELLKTGIIVVFLGAILLIANLLIIFVEKERMQYVNFEYHAVLEINGTGRASVSIPMPTVDWLWSNLEITPSTSTVSVNNSGPEPAFEVIFSENTTLHATTDVLWASAPVNLTRTSDFEDHRYQDDCVSEISLLVLEGSISDVHVVLNVKWSGSCYGPRWKLECNAVPGQSEYLGNWSAYIC